MDGVGESACVRFFITNSMQFSPLTVHLSVQRATTKSVSTRKIKRNHVGAGFPRPIASITDPGGENPPLRWIAWLRLIFKDHKRRARLNRRSAAEDAMSKNTRKVSEP